MPNGDFCYRVVHVHFMDDLTFKKDQFHPLVKSWFAGHFGHPTPIQATAWSRIAANRHVLITAPTGSGKTLAAFLWALNQLITGKWESGQTRILYVSPLKALNNDIQRNLILPLNQLQDLFNREKHPFPPIRVMTRSGDTSSSQRRKMIRQPPEILITTPESLHLLLSSHGGRSILRSIRTVIMDEIHAVVGDKRGTLLISAVDRLVELSGEFQRVALSATVNPIHTVADFIGGYRMEGDLREPVFTKRSVDLCQSTAHKNIELHIRSTPKSAFGEHRRNLWEEMADSFRDAIEGCDSTLIFVNSRRLCEKLTFLINADRPEPIAYSHHGSLSKELRLDVEQRLKSGQLKAIVATASLELGIDIGSLDQVILVQSPPSVTSAVQRIGRAGHGVGETSRATFVPTHAMDLIGCAVLAKAVLEGKIEPVQPVLSPLDVLSQVLVAMVGVATWDVDELFHTVRASYPFHELQRTAFDFVLEMLAGRYASTRIPSLKPKIALDRVDNIAAERKGALLSLYASGGVIPDRGYFSLRNRDSGARVGELDEEFVWEAKIGQVFTLGTQNWRIERITHNDVFVSPANPKVPAPPFWRAEEMDRDVLLSEMIASFLTEATEQGCGSLFAERLASEYGMDAVSADVLVCFLKNQQEKTGSPLPHRHHVVVEWISSQKGRETGCQIVIHTLWGGKVNRPFALALEAVIEKKYGYSASAYPSNNTVHLLLPSEAKIPEIMTLVQHETVESLLRKRLEGSGIFGARFRECAARALLLPRKGFHRRMPLWLTRQRSQKLLDSVKRFEDFPILLEAWRTCLQDDFDLPALKQLLQELEIGQIRCSEIQLRSPSPMALSGSWRLLNRFMYADDRQKATFSTRTSKDLLDEVVFNAQLRPTVNPDIICAFIQKRQRVYPGYGPDSPLELLEWVKERYLIPEPEWTELLHRIEKDHGICSAGWVASIADKLCRISSLQMPAQERPLIAASEFAFQIAEVLYGHSQKVRFTSMYGKTIQQDQLLHKAGNTLRPEAIDILSQWLRYYGPVTLDFISDQLRLDRRTLLETCNELLEMRVIISGVLIRGRQEQVVCNADNFDMLLRIARHRQIPSIEPRDLLSLSPILARYQKVYPPGHSVEDLTDRLQPLLGYPIVAKLWETEILPARSANFDSQWMDRILNESGMIWKGDSRGRLAFCHPQDLDLLEKIEEEEKRPTITDQIQQKILHLFPNRRGRYTLGDLMEDTPSTGQPVRELLWEAFWRGVVTNDSMRAIRQELWQKRKKPDPPIHRIQNARKRRLIQQGRRGFSGTWRIIPPPAAPEGLMEAEELAKERVRLLMDRYGILFRQLLARELPALQWAAIFRSLRLMELSGEVVTGYFFYGIPGLQFVSKRMLRLLQEKQADDSIYWINAQDPASICGLNIDAVKKKLPRRLPGTHLVYLGNQLVLVSQQSAKKLSIYFPVDHPQLPDCLCVFDHLLGRRIDPRPSLTVETINEENAVESEYLEIFKPRFDIVFEQTSVVLYRSIGEKVGNG